MKKKDLSFYATGLFFHRPPIYFLIYYIRNFYTPMNRADDGSLYKKHIRR